MAIDDIKKNLEQRFSEPLPEFYERRIIFWNDEEKEFIDEVNELELSNAKVLVLTENNNFKVKKRNLERIRFQCGCRKCILNRFRQLEIK